MTAASDELLARAGSDPWSVVTEALMCEANGEQLPQELEEAAYLAGTVLAATALMRAGLDPEGVERQFLEREYSIRFTFEAATDQFGVTVTWEDGTVTTASQGDDA